jgi:hypothetical protein
MPNWKNIIRNRVLSITRQKSGDPPRGSLFLGIVDGQHLYLTARDRSYHLLIIGGIGTGKTVTAENLIRQDIEHGRGVVLIDPMGALFKRVLGYLCYCAATGRRIPEVILFNPSENEWVLPFNPFVRKDGELSVQVDRLVAATLRAWGQDTGNDTPRLEKWLTCLFCLMIECNLTLLEAAWLLDRNQQELREQLLSRISNSFIRKQFEQLSHFKPFEFSQQLESVENRLMRFLASGHLGRIFGAGTNALDFQKIMDEGKILLVNLQPGKFLSHEQAQLIGIL